MTGLCLVEEMESCGIRDHFEVLDSSLWSICTRYRAPLAASFDCMFSRVVFAVVRISSAHISNYSWLCVVTRDHAFTALKSPIGQVKHSVIT